MRIEQRLDELGLVLPQTAQVPPGIKISFSWVRVHGNRAFVSGMERSRRTAHPPDPSARCRPRSRRRRRKRPPVAPRCRCWEVSNKPWVILTG
jgi:hypothetical protein